MKAFYKTQSALYIQTSLTMVGKLKQVHKTNVKGKWLSFLSLANKTACVRKKEMARDKEREHH